MKVWRKFAASTIVLAPLTAGAADLLRMRAENTGDVGATEWGAPQIKAQLQAIQGNLALYEVASWLALAAAVLTIPAAMLLWSLAVNRSRRWAWAGGVLAICSVVGQFAHLMGYYALNQILVAGDLNVGVQTSLQAGTNGFAMALVLPFLAGELLAYPVLAIALRKARVIPTWALVVVLAGSVLFAALASSATVTPIRMLALAVGFTPAALAAARTMAGSVAIVFGQPQLAESPTPGRLAP